MTQKEQQQKILEQSITQFAVQNSKYYVRELTRIQSKRGFVRSFNAAAALLGPIWGAARRLWGFFWIFAILEMIAFVQIGRGLWGDLGAGENERYNRLLEKAKIMIQKAQESAGTDNEESYRQIAQNMQNAAEQAKLAAQTQQDNAINILIIGLVLLLCFKIIQGFCANKIYEKRYSKWRINPAIGAGISPKDTLIAIFLMIVMLPLTLVRFTASKPHEWLIQVPVNKEHYNQLSIWFDVSFFDYLAKEFGDVFDGVTTIIRTILNGLETALVDTPWMVSMIVIIALAWRLAGFRVALFTGAGLLYLAILGFWENSMITVALLGAAAMLCIGFGIPLGILCGKNERIYTIIRPILDFMQTMPAFVYLIPVIAFFGTGKPAGILATVIFGMPPVVRLTALGIRGVPENIKEAAVAFGCSKRKLLFDVEIPLAIPSIMTGVNQTILMCLSMVVIASLIGASGLGKDVLDALQYAAKGQGLLSGFAILICAMIIDRIVQGKFNRRESDI